MVRVHGVVMMVDCGLAKLEIMPHGPRNFTQHNLCMIVAAVEDFCVEKKAVNFIEGSQPKAGHAIWHFYYSSCFYHSCSDHV